MKSSKFVPGFEFLSNGAKSFIKILLDVLLIHLEEILQNFSRLKRCKVCTGSFKILQPMLNGIDTFKQLITWTGKKSNKAEFLDNRDFSFLREKFATFSSFKKSYGLVLP